VGAYRGLLYEMIKSEDAKDKDSNKSERLRDKKSQEKQPPEFVLQDRSSKNSSSVEKREKYNIKWTLPKKHREKRYESTKLKADYHGSSIRKDRTIDNASSLSKGKKPKRHSLIDNLSEERRVYADSLEDKQKGCKKLNEIIIKVPRCAPVNATFIQYSQYLKNKKPPKKQK
jgi:hypothetical protein